MLNDELRERTLDLNRIMGILDYTEDHKEKELLKWRVHKSFLAGHFSNILARRRKNATSR